MKALSKQAEAVFRKALALMGEGDHVRIGKEDGPYMPLVVEKVWSVPIYSFAHYGEQNGDAMRDPEMCFLDLGPGRFIPTSYRNDYAGVDQDVLTSDGAGSFYCAAPKVQADMASFAAIWARNLREQHPELRS